MQEHRIAVPLGIEGFRVTGCVPGVLGLEVRVETTAPAGLCPECHGIALIPKERPVVVVRDLPIQAQPTYLVWRKRRYACPDCARSFTESCAEIPPRARVTRRYERHLYGTVARGSSILRVARDEDLTFYRVQLAFSKGARGAFARRPPVAPRVLGIDEAAHKKGQDYNTVVTDPQAHEVLEVLRGRDGASLQSWLSALPADVRAGIAAVAIDMWAPYRRVAAACLPEATVVCDKFHVVRIVGKALDRVRRRLQRRHGSTRRTSGWQPSLFRLRHALLADPARLRSGKRAELRRALVAAPALRSAYGLYQGFRRFYAEATEETAPVLLHRFYRDVERSGLLEFSELVDRGLRLWEPEILAYFETGLTNGYTEGVTNKVKVIKRVAYGFRNFERFRERVLVQCGAA